MTGRSAMLLLFVVSVAGVVAGTAIGVSFVPGASFAVGCLMVAAVVRERDLLTLVVAPPLIFLAAILAGELGAMVGKGGGLQSLGFGMVAELTTGAPWLFGGTALVLMIALFRGLPGNVRRLRDEVRGGRPPSRGGRRRRSARDEDRDPEPAPEQIREGYFEPREYGR